MDKSDDTRVQPDHSDHSDQPTVAGARDWLQRTHSVTLPGWAFACAGVFGLVLLLVALD